jgi:hypothetical protein
MKTRFLSFAAIAVLLFSLVGMSAGDTHRGTAAGGQAARLVSLLPATDAVAVFDAKRFFGSLPKILAANQPILTKITGHIAEIQNRTGIDLRKFDQVAVGVAMKAGEGKDLDCDPVAIASGDINAGALVAMAKLASNGKYREEKVAGRSMYIVTIPAAVKKTASPSTTPHSKIAQVISKHLNDLPTDIAVSALDGKTLAIGCPDLVRAILEGKSHANPELTSLLSPRETTIVSFAMKTPGVISSMFPLDNDALGKTINSIQILSGSVDVTDAGASLQMMARTTTAKTAAELKDTLEVLQMFGGTLASSKLANKKAYGRLIKNIKLGVNGTDVTIDLLVPQADIDVMVAQLK